MIEFLGGLFIFLMMMSIVHQSIFYSIFFLISLFFCSSFLFILLGFEFIGFLYLIVYVGAVAVLFLFMVMLFDKSEYLFFFSEEREGFFTKFWFQLLGLFIAVIHFFLLLILLDFYASPMSDLGEHSHIYFAFGSNLQRIGFLLYTYYSLALLAGALVLLVGMVGAIVLTQRFFFIGSYNRHQNIKDQILRKRV